MESKKQRETGMVCPICGKPIMNGETYCLDKNGLNPAHLECAFQRVVSLVSKFSGKGGRK